MNTSATGGYIAEAPSPITREQQENILHEMIAGLTGLDPKLVRPAFQETPLAEPKAHINWCAFHIQDSDATNYPEVRHISDGDGHDEVTDWLNKDARLYFYGPQSEAYAGMVRRGLHIEQNRYELRKAGMAIRRVGNASQVPELVNGKWLARTDLVVSVTFEAVGRYAVLNLLQSGGAIISDEYRGGEQLTTNYDTDNHKPY